MTYGNSNFFAVGAQGIVLKSSDGTSWSSVNTVASDNDNSSCGNSCGFSNSNQLNDISYGRSPDGISNWQLFEIPTPGDFNQEISSCPIGDINCDYTINVLDVVQLVAFILGNSELTDEQQELGDLNFDGSIDVLDVVTMLGIILDY